MSKLSKNEIYLLRHLKECGLKGQPFSNLVTVLPMTIENTLSALKSLQEKKLLKFKGPKTPKDLEPLVAAAAGKISPPVLSENGDSWTSDNDLVFADAARSSSEFFKTQVLLTLRGHAVLVFVRENPAARDVAAPASTPAPRAD